MTGQLGGNGDERQVQGPRLDSPRPGSLRLVECLLCGARWVNDTGVCERCGGHDWKDVTLSEGGPVITLRVFTPDRVIFLYDTDGNEVRRVEASDATPDSTTVFPDAPLQVGSITILAAQDVYA